MSTYFNNFPRTLYRFGDETTSNRFQDLSTYVEIFDAIKDNSSAHTYYHVQDRERPDQLSFKLYGTTDYYWTFFVINDFLHDGYRAWPMSQEDLFDYIAKEYEGYVIETNPVITRDTDQLITDHRNSLAGRFTLGETITGATSGATGTLTSKITDLSQLVVQNVTGAFIGDQTPGSNTTELVVGGTSEDSVSTYNVYKYAEAPYYYHRTDDADKKPVTNANHIVGGVDALHLSYVSNRSHIIEENDERTKIRIIDPAYVEQFVDQFEELINE